MKDLVESLQFSTCHVPTWLRFSNTHVSHFDKLIEFKWRICLLFCTMELYIHSFCGFIFCVAMMTSSKGNIFHVTVLVTGEFSSQMPVTRSFDIFFDLRLNKWSSSNQHAGDLRRHLAHYDVTVMGNVISEALMWYQPLSMLILCSHIWHKTK